MQRRKLLAVMGPILFGLSRFRTGTNASSTDASSLSTSLTPETRPSSGSIQLSTGGSGSTPTTYSSTLKGSGAFSMGYLLNASGSGFPTATLLSEAERQRL